MPESLAEFIERMHARAATIREAGDAERATLFDAAARDLQAALEANEAAHGKKVDLFLRAEEISKAFGRVVLEGHETAAELGAAPAWAALERLEEAFERCRELMYPGDQ